MHYFENLICINLYSLHLQVSPQSQDVAFLENVSVVSSFSMF